MTETNHISAGISAAIEAKLDNLTTKVDALTAEKEDQTAKLIALSPLTAQVENLTAENKDLTAKVEALITKSTGS